MSFALTYGSFGDVLDTAKLAVKVVRLLCNGPRLSQERLDMATELQALNRDLIAFNFTASGVHIDPSCAHSLEVVICIRAEVESCRLILSRFLDKLGPPKGITGSIVAALSEETELAKLRKGISRPIKSIRTLMAGLNLVTSEGIQVQINSVVVNLRDVGTQILAVGNRVDLVGDRLAAFQEAILKLPISRGVSEDLFCVIDPVGGNIPISLRYFQVYTVGTLQKLQVVNLNFAQDLDRITI
ncbi:hypothetical protein DFH07DRAFT_778865 [Mycena maculata]|uniref:Uncharacterized protein n=1 Tax=Mycena maculata TaxID=230809 RepID=A0AAD7IBH2_9AGAR|nr:hypothetical protein DFH07DRAFT_778865 [Mycena maculata]